MLAKQLCRTAKAYNANLLSKVRNSDNYKRLLIELVGRAEVGGFSLTVARKDFGLNDENVLQATGLLLREEKFSITSDAEYLNINWRHHEPNC